MGRKLPKIIRADAKILKARKPEDIHLYYEDIRPQIVVEGLK